MEDKTVEEDVLEGVDESDSNLRQIGRGLRYNGCFL